MSVLDTLAIEAEIAKYGGDVLQAAYWVWRAGNDNDLLGALLDRHEPKTTCCNANYHFNEGGFMRCSGCWLQLTGVSFRPRSSRVSEMLVQTMMGNSKLPHQTIG